ncbi:MAG: efflux transporter permease [Nitrospirae bacterium]|jgi:cell division transport system permease protein|nr:efflux transporter permease [Nitrospirota bacterium]
MIAPYALRLAVQSLLREKWINLLSVMTIAAGLFIISVSFFVLYNIDIATKNLPEKFAMTVYLDNSLHKDKLGPLIDSFRKNKAVLSVRYISRDEAMKELKSSLKNSDYILEGLEENPLPESLEIKLKKDEVEAETAQQLASEALKIKGVTEVDYGEKFLSTLQSIKKGFKSAGLAFAAILSTGMIFVCYSTVKILFYRRTEEIETFKLLGATKGFIRTPFLIEGAVIGTCGGLLSLAGCFLLYYTFLLRLSITMPIFKTILFPADLFLPLPIIGMVLGITGAVIALGRLRY